MKKIKTVDEYIKAAMSPYVYGKEEDDRIPDVAGHIFFRGQTKSFKNSDLSASIYRQKEAEDYYLREFLKRFPDRFNKDMTNYTKLALMQHIGVPTRLLDITIKPLVALYFAVEDCNSGADGLVWRFHAGVPRRSLDLKTGMYPSILGHLSYKRYDSDTLELLSTMAFQKQSTKMNLLNAVNKLLYTITKIGRKYEVNHFCLLDYLSEVLGNPHDLYDQHLASIVQNNKNSEKIFNELMSAYKKFTETSALKTLLHAVKKDINDFETRINVLDFVGPYIAEPAITNSRIREQGGYFLFTTPFFKMNQPISNLKSFSEMEAILFMEDNKITIDRNFKAAIKEQLDFVYGINKSTLFPDMYSTAEYLRDDNPFSDTRVYPNVTKKIPRKYL